MERIELLSKGQTVKLREDGLYDIEEGTYIVHGVYFQDGNVVYEFECCGSITELTGDYLHAYGYFQHDDPILIK